MRNDCYCRFLFWIMFWAGVVVIVTRLLAPALVDIVHLHNEQIEQPSYECRGRWNEKTEWVEGCGNDYTMEAEP